MHFKPITALTSVKVCWNIITSGVRPTEIHLLNLQLCLRDEKLLLAGCSCICFFFFLSILNVRLFYLAVLWKQIKHADSFTWNESFCLYLRRQILFYWHEKQSQVSECHCVTFDPPFSKMSGTSCVSLGSQEKFWGNLETSRAHTCCRKSQ